MCNTVLSAEEGALPDGAVLTVSQETPSKSDEASVNTTLGQTVARVYAASLTLNGDPVTPTGTVELGFAIPAEYQNGIVSVSRINDDGTPVSYTHLLSDAEVDAPDARGHDHDERGQLRRLALR